MSEKLWPPPGFPLVEGDYLLTETWALHLPEPFARRIEDGSLVLWRPGLTFWFSAWGNDLNESSSDRLFLVKQQSSPHRFDERESMDDGLTRFAYRCCDDSEAGPVESINAFVFATDGHLQLSAYFDDPTDESKAWGIVESVFVRCLNRS